MFVCVFVCVRCFLYCFAKISVQVVAVLGDMVKINSIILKYTVVIQYSNFFVTLI